MDNLKQKIIFSAAMLCCASVQAQEAGPSGAAELFRAGRFKEACSAYRAEAPSGKDRLIEAARACSYADEHASSIAFYGIINSSYSPAQTDLLREEADQLRWAGDKKKAVDAFRKSIAISAADPAALCGLA